MNAPKPVNVRELGVQIDERLAELYDAEYMHMMDAQMNADRLRRAAGQKQDRDGRWDGTLPEAVAYAETIPEPSSPYASGANAYNALQRYKHAREQLAQIHMEQAEGNAVYGDHRWSRAFLVTNQNGHVHKSMNCSTCFPTTRYEWLTAYSGADEKEIVKASGELACTVCYPSAPADVLNKEPNLISRSRAEKDAAAAVRAAEKAERERKRVEKSATPDGSPLLVPTDNWYESRIGDRPKKLTTEASASRLWVDIEMGKSTDSILKPGPAQLETQSIITQSLAAKHGRTPEEQVELMMVKVRAKQKREEREAAKWRR